MIIKLIFYLININDYVFLIINRGLGIGDWAAFCNALRQAQRAQKCFAG